MTGAPAWVEIVVGVAGLLVALGTIWRYILPMIRGAFRLIQGTTQLVEDYNRTGGFAGLYKELHPNGGSSLRDAVDQGRKEAQAAARDARAAVEEAQRIGAITEELRGHAQANRDGIARLDRRMTDEAEKTESLGQRVTDHRRRNDETIARIEQYLTGERDDLLLAKQGLEASVSELLMIDEAIRRPPPDHEPDLD